MRLLRDRSEPVLVVHGGTFFSDSLRGAELERYKQALRDALRSGRDVLANRGSALDAAVAIVRVLEDDPLLCVSAVIGSDAAATPPSVPSSTSAAITSSRPRS